MAEFINTIDVLGDDAVIDSIIDRTITEFKDDKVSRIGAYAFAKCAALTEVDLPNVKGRTGISPIEASAFWDCTALRRVNLPAFDAVASATTNIFSGCTALEDITLPSLKNTAIGLFAGCSSLKTADLPIIASVAGNCFYNCRSLVALILRNTESVCTLANTNNAIAGTPIASGTGYIYVPRALVDSYKAATNWSTYAAQFRALEDYTVDGTITGALDETKI